MEQGRSEGNKSRVNRTLRDFQGEISFEKKLGSTAVSPFFVLALPSSLWRQHGGKIQEFVILQSVANRKKWTVKTCPTLRRGSGSLVKYPLVTLQTGWKAFVVANGLVKGDQLKFTLTDISKFEVLIFRSGAESKVPSMQSPKLRSKLSTFSQRQRKKSLGRQCVNSFVKSEREVNLQAPKKETTEDSIAPAASNVSTDSSEIASDMDSHFYEPEGALLKSFNHTDCPTPSQTALPRFCKRIRGSHDLEIPSKFLKSHWTQIGATYVKLQGIHEESPVNNVMCTSVIVGGRPRLFFKLCCWNDFVKDNSLQIGQKLTFTLTADSFFVVRNAGNLE